MCVELILHANGRLSVQCAEACGHKPALKVRVSEWVPRASLHARALERQLHYWRASEAGKPR
eukprot:6183994-Pleurochrysis_carterae.AAC.3